MLSLGNIGRSNKFNGGGRDIATSFKVVKVKGERAFPINVKNAVARKVFIL